MQTMGLSLTREMPVAHKITDMVLWPYERLSRVVHLTKNGVNCEIEIESEYSNCFSINQYLLVVQNL